MLSYRDVGLIDIMFSSSFGDEEHAVKEKECTLVLGTMDTEGALENQFSICSQIRSLPVYEQRLDFLRWMRQVQIL